MIKKDEPLTKADEERALAAVAREAIIEMRRRRRWQLFFRFFWVAIFALFFLAPLLMPNKIKDALPSAAGKHIAVVNIQGLIAAKQQANANDIIGSLKKAFKNEKAAAIFLDINSGGGSPVQSGQVYRAIKMLKKERNVPVYAVISDIGASGAYYIAAAADKIYADPASIVGSIGVISQSMGYEDLAEKIGIQPRIFTAGEHKNFLGGSKPLEPAEVEHMQAMLDNLHQQFINAVKAGRGERLHEDKYPEVFSGLFWSGEKALDVGLIDGFGDNFSLRQSGELKDLPLVEYSPDLSPIQQLLRDAGMQAATAIQQGLDLGTQTQILAK